MELFQEILQKVFEKEEIQVSFPNVSFSAAEIVEGESYRTLQKIKAVIEDDGLSLSKKATYRWSFSRIRKGNAV